MAQQVVDHDAAAGCDIIKSNRTFDRHLRLGEFGNIFFKRIGEKQLAFLDQHHDRNRNDRLRHRIDAEDRIARHCLIALGIKLALYIEPGKLAAAGDKAHGAGKPAPLYTLTDRSFEPLQGLDRQAKLFGISSRQLRNAHTSPQKISNRPAAPMPPPTHMVTMPHLAPRRLPSTSTWPVMRAPDMP